MVRLQRAGAVVRTSTAGALEVELRALLRSIAQHQEGFHVLTGDFNTLAPGELLDFKKLPARLRRRNGSALVRIELVGARRPDSWGTLETQDLAGVKAHELHQT